MVKQHFHLKVIDSAVSLAIFYGSICCGHIDTSQFVAFARSANL